MKKDKLIALLNEIEGNPEIYLWNGYVEDFVDIEKELVPMVLVKTIKKWLKEAITFEYLRDANKFKDVPYDQRTLTDDDHKIIENMVEDSYKQHYSEWEEPNIHVTQEQFKYWYDRKKTVYVINAKHKGKTYSDLIGDMKY